MRVLVASTVCLASILLGGCWLVDGNRFVLTNPQSVKATTTPNVNIDAVIVDNKKWPIEKNAASASLRAPRSNLAGISIVTAGTGYKNKSEKASVGFGLSLPQNNDATQISLFILGWGIDDLTKNDSLYPEVGYRTDLRIECPKGDSRPYLNESEYPSVTLIPRGPIILEQRKKHITLKGTFDIPPTAIPRDPYMICTWTVDEKGFVKSTSPLFRNPAPPAIIEVRGIHLDIDTDLTYRWCGKGGDCYEK